MRTVESRSRTVPERLGSVPFSKSKSKTEIGTKPTRATRGADSMETRMWRGSAAKQEYAVARRRNPTPAEAALWAQLRGNQLDGLHFRREEPVRGWIADFYCSAASLVVEVDGGYHKGRTAEDELRDKTLLAAGVLTIRIPNDTVLGDMPATLATISEAARGRTSVRRENGPPFESASPARKIRSTTGGSLRHLDPDARRLASEAYALWRDLARERANPYGDHAGCLLAGRMAVDATRWEDGLVILAAIRQRMDSKSSPRWIPEWARELGASRRADRRRVERIAEGRDGGAEDSPNAGRRVPGVPDDIAPEVLRVMRDAAHRRASGEQFDLSGVTCAVCGQFTETKCEKCVRPLHVRACSSRHECEAA